MGSRVDTPESDLKPVVEALHRFRAAIGQHLMAILLDLNLSLPQLRALKVIHDLGQASGRQLARELGVSPASVVPLCDRLQEQGYVERVRDTEDRRICWFRLTQAGTELMQGLSAIGRSRIVPALARLPPTDRAFLVRVLDTLTAVIAEEGSVPGSPPHARSAR